MLGSPAVLPAVNGHAPSYRVGVLLIHERPFRVSRLLCRAIRSCFLDTYNLVKMQVVNIVLLLAGVAQAHCTSQTTSIRLGTWYH